MDKEVFNLSFVLQFFGKETPHLKHFFIEVMKIFLVETEKKLPQVALALKENNLESALSSLHSLKGSASQVGAEHLCLAMQTAENTINNHQALPKDDWIEILLIWENTKSKMEQWIRTLP